MLVIMLVIIVGHFYWLFSKRSIIIVGCIVGHNRQKSWIFSWVNVIWSVNKLVKVLDVSKMLVILRPCDPNLGRLVGHILGF